MTATTLKKQLHKVIDSTHDTSLLEAVYTILNKEQLSQQYDIDAQQYKLIEERKKLYNQGKLKEVTLLDIKKKALSKIKK